jgi:hypothetical protein
MTITSRPSNKHKIAEDSKDELGCNLPNYVISVHILPFVCRSTWDNLIVACREICQQWRNLEAPWSVGELIRRFGYAGAEENEEDDDVTHEQREQLSVLLDGQCLCVLSDQRIQTWCNAVGSCGHIAVDVRNRFREACLWSMCFSPVQNLLVPLHNINAFRLWEVNTGGMMVFKAEFDRMRW